MAATAGLQAFSEPVNMPAMTIQPEPMLPKVRPFQEQELETLIDLWQAAWQAARPDIDFAARRAWFTAYLAELRKEGAMVLVACLEGEAAGFATIDPESGYLDTLAVAPTFQRRGVARALLAEAGRIARDGVTLKVNTLNLAGQKLYAREGFRQIGSEIKPDSGETVLVLYRGRNNADVFG